MPKVQVITLGCSKNLVDTAHLLALLPPDSFEIMPEDYAGPVDFLLLNTCGFIADAKQESIDAILAQAERRKNGEIGRLIVFGCLSQRYAAELPSLMPEVDAWFGARDLSPVVRELGATPDETMRLKRRAGTDGRPYAYLKISEGCDRRCSYCAIPLIRGAHRSVPMEDLLEEARGLAEKGVKELILIAQDTTYYGLDLYGKRSLAALMRQLSRIDGIEWIRLHYSYPEGFPDDVLEEMASNPKICRYLDIPLQHISDRVLHNMHRGVTGEWTRNLIARMREKVPGVVLRTTLIVGHPGEGPVEFEELTDFIRDSRFERMGAFRYSEEEGTWGALHLKDDVPQEEKQRRYDALMGLQEGISAGFNASRIGSEEKVLVDAVLGDKLIARSQYESPEVDGEIIVNLPEGAVPASYVGKFINVRITGAEDYDLFAEPI